MDLNSKYRLLYNLQEIEYLIEVSDASDEIIEIEDKHKNLWIYDSRLLERKKVWKNDFIMHGGLDHLYKALKIIEIENSTRFSSLKKVLTS